MNDSDFSPQYGQSVPLRPPAIGGTAMVNGVHLSTRTFGTGSFTRLFLTGFTLMSIGAFAMVLTYVALWVIGRAANVSLIELWMQVVGPFEMPGLLMWQIFTSLLSFLLFLVVVRLTPLAGYHGAEHKVVHAIERYGYPTLALARDMPRIHRRCGTTLLAGILPAFLIAAPLAVVEPMLALLVVFLGWMTRFRVGGVIQQYLTTREPTDAQLQAGLHAGYEVLARWRRDPFATVPPLTSFWRRGMIQMLLGVIVGMQFFNWVYQRLHLWLDWELWLH